MISDTVRICDEIWPYLLHFVWSCQIGYYGIFTIPRSYASKEVTFSPCILVLNGMFSSLLPQRNDRQKFERQFRLRTSLRWKWMECLTVLLSQRWVISPSCFSYRHHLTSQLRRRTDTRARCDTSLTCGAQSDSRKNRISLLKCLLVIISSSQDPRQSRNEEWVAVPLYGPIINFRIPLTPIFAGWRWKRSCSFNPTNEIGWVYDGRGLLVIYVKPT